MKLIVCTISRADLKAQNYKAAVKQSSGVAAKKRNIGLVAVLLKKVTTT